MIKLLAFVLLGIASSFCFSGSEQRVRTEGNHFGGIFNSAEFIKLKYRPVDALGSRPTTALDIKDKWLYSASKNCSASCSRSAKKLREFLEESKPTDKDCSKPIFAVVEFLTSDGGVVGTIAVNATGRCFILGKKVFISPYLFTQFVIDNRISIFESK